MLHIEISGDTSPRELKAVKALIACLLGETSTAAVAASAPAPATIPETPAAPETPAVPEVSTIPAPPLSAVPPPPVAGTDAVPGEVPPPPPAGVDVDKDGLPWDGRIHASTKTKTKGDQWTKKRQVDPALVAQVEAELRAVMAAPAVSAGSVPPPPTGEPGPVQTDPAAAFGGAPSTPADAPPAVTETASPAPMAEFARIMRVVTGKQAAGTLATETVAGIAQALGITGVKDLAARPDLIPAFEALLP